MKNQKVCASALSLGCRLTWCPWDWPDFMCDFGLLLACRNSQLIQTHSEAQQMLLWASSMFRNGNEAWNQVLSVLSWIMDFLLVRTQFTHLLDYHFWSVQCKIPGCPWQLVVVPQDLLSSIRLSFSPFEFNNNLSFRGEWGLCGVLGANTANKTEPSCGLCEVLCARLCSRSEKI